ncbi:hypothetical protein BJX63DRAFT_108638 [Aspergillus granulosus]|uniref:Uncharacterized protein n=1 Tax=Aspergillus granulosus TaxID=176169 RepID=A0ABR4HRC6_9EURO
MTDRYDWRRAGEPLSTGNDLELSSIHVARMSDPHQASKGCELPKASSTSSAGNGVAFMWHVPPCSLPARASLPGAERLSRNQLVPSSCLPPLKKGPAEWFPTPPLSISSPIQSDRRGYSRFPIGNIASPRTARRRRDTAARAVAEKCRLADGFKNRFAINQTRLPTQWLGLVDSSTIMARWCWVGRPKGEITAPLPSIQK